MRIKPHKPQPGQESVWDYPRPPRLEASAERIRVVMGDLTIADSTNTKRILETSHPPVYYIPPQDVAREHLRKSDHHTFCEWKGTANYYSICGPDKTITDAAWFYTNPSLRFRDLEGYIAFYPSKVDACFVDDLRVQPQPGDFYGGWITSKIVGPFKGAPGTFGW